MAIVVEDGTGLSNASALVSVATFKAYCDARGLDYGDYTDTLIEKAIVRATSFLSNSYKWKGWPLNGREQSLAWPRVGVTDREGYSIASNVIPVEVESACSEITLRELSSPGYMTPDYVPSERIKSEQVGPINTEYDLSRVDAESARPILLIVRDLIGGLLEVGSGSRLAGQSIRY